jgi:hypothetical protein
MGIAFLKSTPPLQKRCFFYSVCKDFAHPRLVFGGNSKESSYNIYRGRTNKRVRMTHEKDKKRRDALKKKGGEIEALVFFKQGGGEKHYGTPCRLFSFLLSEAEWGCKLGVK